METQSAFSRGIMLRSLASLAAMCLTAAAALALIPAAGANSTPSPTTETVDGIEITLTGVVDVGDDIQISGSTATRVQTPGD